MTEEQLNKIRQALRKDAQDKQIVEKEIPQVYKQNLSMDTLGDVVNEAINIDLRNQSNRNKDLLLNRAAQQMILNPTVGQIPDPALMEASDNDSFKNILNRVYLQGLQKQRGSK